MIRAAVLLLLAPACATMSGAEYVGEGALGCPSGAGWVTVSSRHFDVFTDRSVTIAKENATRLEELFSAYADAPGFGVPIQSPPEGRITVIVFGSEEDYFHLPGTRGSGGLFYTAYNTVEPRPVIVLRQRLWQDASEVVAHELSHYFLFHVTAAAPRWVVEGLADYQRSMELSDGEVTVGALPAKYQTFNKLLPPLSKVLSWTQGMEMYPAAFALVHLINDTEEGQLAFRDYLSLLAGGSHESEAFARALSRLDWTQMGRDLPSYFPRLHWVTRTIRFQRARVDLTEPRAVTHAELHRLWAAIRPWSRDNEALVERDLDEAATLDAASGETQYLRAAHLAFRGEIAKALATLEPLHAVAAGDPQIQALYCHLVLAAALKNGEPRHRVEVEVARLAEMATTAGALRILAYSQGSLGRPVEALAAADRAITLRPGESVLHQTRAAALHRLGRDPEAVAEQSIAIALMPHGLGTESLEKRLAEYQRPSGAVNVDDGPAKP